MVTRHVIQVPVPSVVLLIGASGSGKSTFAHRHFGPFEILSSDRCRAMIADDESDQSVTAEAFELLRAVMAARLAYGRLCVVDATNLHQHARLRSLEIARAHGVPTVAVALDVSPQTCLTHNARRGRTVDEGVIRQQLDDLRRALLDLETEGYAGVHVLGEDEVATARIARTSQAASPVPGPRQPPVTPQ